MEHQFSPFEVKSKNLELIFTYYYFLGFSLSLFGKGKNKNIKLKSQSDFFIPRPWKIAEPSNNIRGRHIDELMLDHFHLCPDKLDLDSMITTKVNEGGKDYKFKISAPKHIHTEHSCDEDNPIGAIECSLLKSGYLVLSIRLINEDDMQASDILELIKHPEQLSQHSSTWSEIGDLILKMEDYVEVVENTISQIIIENKYIITTRSINDDKDGILKHCDSNIKEKKALAIRRICDGNIKRSRPYIGTIFGLPQHKKAEELLMLMPGIKNFVIAAARTTPSFLTQFINSEKYLDSNNRNIYAPGTSIVFISKRGWCTFNNGDQDSHFFRSNVIDTTLFVIMLTNSLAKEWNMFIDEINREGRKIFDEFNESVRILLGTHFLLIPMKICNLIAFHKNMSYATSFLARARKISPPRKLTRLLEANITSQTARVAVVRCEHVTLVNNLETVANEKLDNYSLSITIGSEYIQSKVAQYTIISLSFVVVIYALNSLGLTQVISEWVLSMVGLPWLNK